MPLLSVANLVHSHGLQRVLDGVSFALEPGERVGLVGRNGTGKTTLLRAIAGDLAADAGQVQIARGTRVGFLRQHHDLDPDDTLKEAAEAAFAELHDLHRQARKLTEKMAEASGEELDRVLKRYEQVERDIERLGGYAVEHRVEETLHGLGFADEQFNLPVRVLSGGQRSRVSLARLLLEEPDLLLLDEPTNHLDIDGRRWLETFLSEQFRGAVIVVSHDRYLLNAVVQRIMEIDSGGRIFTYPGDYETYRELRQERLLTEQRVYEKQLQHIRSEQSFIDRYRAGQRARQASGRSKRLERFKDQVAGPRIELGVMKLNLPPAPRTGDVVLDVEHLSKRFGDKVIVDDLTHRLARGDRLGIIGPNGAGKSTILKLLLGEVPADAGKVRFGSNVNVGYFSQTHENLNLDLTVWQYLQSVILSLDTNARASEQRARDLAGAFLFSGDDQDKLLGQLSGGERSRVVLAGLVAGGHNLLVLDEPTNHFDIPSMERLEAALDPETGYDGTLMLVSHDRALLDACVDQLLILDNRGHATFFRGNYSQWREHVAQREASARPGVDRPPSPSTARPPRAPQPAAAPARLKSAPAGPGGALTKLNFEKLEQRIESIQERLREIDRAFADPDLRNPDRIRSLQAERAALAGELEPLEAEWERRVAEM